jgi:hypothetical protein
LTAHGKATENGYEEICDSWPLFAGICAFPGAVTGVRPTDEHLVDQSPADYPTDYRADQLAVGLDQSPAGLDEHAPGFDERTLGLDEPAAWNNRSLSRVGD